MTPFCKKKDAVSSSLATDHSEIKIGGSCVYVNKRLYRHIVFPSNSTAWTVCSQRSCVVLVTQRFICAVLLQCATPAMCYDPSPHYLHTKHNYRIHKLCAYSESVLLPAVRALLTVW